MTVDTYSHLIPGAGRQALAAHLESIPQHLLVLQQRAIEPGRVGKQQLDVRKEIGRQCWRPKFFGINEPCWGRTSDPHIKSVMLYQLS
jgi:hypothetical protein